ncbi:hypothetical protein PPYR_10807 [Photinus pyralis]|uniref:Sodium-coupled monocarboxylate transporter 1 n=1 Tax=Photinus pyralis TaxID=7054 RepID=A0A5N4AHI8_PHOPY|nr:hypothetical protein PPYR_10807 [Photinus pyralis]
MNSSLIEIRTSIPPITFSWLDYVVFAALLGMSGSIGIFFGCFGSKQNSSGEYLLGGKRLHIVPVAMSIIASNISGLAVLGAPADIYRYGAYFIWSIIPILTSSLACVYVFMPVLLQLELITTYQYLQLRFACDIQSRGYLPTMLSFQSSNRLQHLPNCSSHNCILRFLYCNWRIENGRLDRYSAKYLNTFRFSCGTRHGTVPEWWSWQRFQNSKGWWTT